MSYPQGLVDSADDIFGSQAQRPHGLGGCPLRQASADRAKPMPIRDGDPRLPLTLGEGNAAMGADFNFGARSLGSLSRTLEPRRGKP